MKTLLLLSTCLFLPMTSFADIHEAEEQASSNVGPDNAVTEASPEQGIKLSDKASQALGIQTSRVKNTSSLAISESALVRSRDEIGVYRLRDGWYKLIDYHDIKPGDEIVTQGAPLLRVAELDAFSAGEAGHAH